jgi:hypothetical protein
MDMVMDRAGLPVRGELKLELDVLLIYSLVAHSAWFATAGSSPDALGTVVR